LLLNTLTPVEIEWGTVAYRERAGRPDTSAYRVIVPIAAWSAPAGRCRSIRHSVAINARRVACAIRGTRKRLTLTQQTYGRAGGRA